MSSRANFCWPASCVRCAVLWPCPWPCASKCDRAPWCCRASARRPRHGSARSTFAQPLPAQPARATPDLRDVKGQAAAKRALKIAAAAGHSLLFIGPPDTGKSMLALRLSGTLPPMVEDEALVSAALQGLATQRFDADDFGVRLFRSPHHSGSSVALVGGGSPPRPGEFSLAHGGLLFLDRLPDFLRAARQAVFPARI